ncbi:hypothetical protein AVEN_62891-1 [Araneus ventricosus]|uniref:Dehydrogenase/reductase SDR family member 11 n=1 Tax=Araneus ventricosus TaxID=182803 RepID=A0A4Y2KN79_ARAVE|nr:hypothetical protein AVEN_62891-1 [Araneus ventricosus]
MAGVTEAQASVMRRRISCNASGGLAYTCPFICPHKQIFSRFARFSRRHGVENHNQTNVHFLHSVLSTNVRKSICPGIVETEFFVNYSSKISAAEASAYFKSFDPLRPKDIADSVLYILSAPPHVEVHDILIQPIENSI